MNIEPKYYDNFLEEHIAQLIDMELREVSWQYDYDSVKNGVNKHWHVFIGHDEGEIEDFGYHISMVWNQIKNKFPEYKLERAYLNAHTHGLEPHIHRDDGDVTILYMVCGEGDFKLIKDFSLVNKKDDQTAEIQPKEIEEFKFEENKLILFDAKTPHKGEAPKKGMRITLAFKTNWVKKND